MSNNDDDDDEDIVVGVVVTLETHYFTWYNNIPGCEQPGDYRQQTADSRDWRITALRQTTEYRP